MRSTTLFLALASLTPSLAAQDARLSVLHGVPGLSGPVDVVANGSTLFSFDYTDIRGPIAVPAGPLSVEIRLGGNPILSANVTLQAGVEYSAIAHLDAGGAPTVTLFTDDMSPIASGQARATVRHTAQAPTVDVGIDQNGSRALTIASLSNPNEAAADVPSGSYDVSLFLAGTTNRAFGPVALTLAEDVSYRVYAVGDVSAPNFALLVQPVDFSPAGAHSRLSVIHGIPGLPAAVEVVADEASLFTFNYTDVRGAFEVPSGPTQIEVRLNGVAVLTANVVLENGREYSAIAHLDAAGQNTLSLFEEDITPIAAGNTRVTVRHTAQAPAVDVGIDQTGARALTIPGLTNPNEAAADVPFGAYDATLFLAGTTNVAFGPAALNLAESTSYQVYAVGVAGAASFTVVVQATNFEPDYTITTAGVACGGSISASTNTAQQQVPFDVLLSGGAQNANAVLFVGVDDTQLGGVALPFDLALIGAPGCLFYTDGRFSVPTMTGPAGAASQTFTLPEGAARFLEDAYFQWAFASSNNSFGFEFTEYLELVRN